MEINEFIAKKIKEIRQVKGISQEKLALSAGIDRTYMQSIESGQRNISVDVFVKICKALDTKVTDLLKDFE